MRLWFSKSVSNETKSAPIASIAEPDDSLFALFGVQPSLAGPVVTPASALSVPAVSCAVELISTAIGALPLKVFRHLSAGGKEPAPDHPAYTVAHDWSNPWTSSAELRAALVASALLHGHGYAAAIRINGRAAELTFFDPASVKAETTAAGEPVYIVRNQAGGERPFTWRDMIVVSAPFGAPIKRAREAIALALVMEQHSARIFARGGRPSGVISLKTKAGDGVIKRLAASWSAAHSGANAGGTAILEEGAEFQPIAFKSIEMELLEQRKFQIIEIARAFRVAPSLLMDFSRATWANSEESNRQFLQTTLRPWLTAVENAFTRVLLTPEERADYSIEFVTGDLERADLKSRAEAIAKMRAAGVITANEGRALENLPARDDGDELGNPFTTSQNKQEAPANE